MMAEQSALHHIFYFESGHADDTIENIQEFGIKTLQAALLAYQRGEFTVGLCYVQDFSPLHPDYPLSVLIEAICSIAINDINGLCRSEQKIEELYNQYQHKDPVVLDYVKFMKMILDISLRIPLRAPDWLRNGDILSLPLVLRQIGLEYYIRYLEIQGEYDKMLHMAESALMLCYRPPCYTVSEVRILLFAALGHLQKGTLDLAEQRVLQAMRLALPDRLIMVFADSLTALHGLIEKCMKQEFPQWYGPVIEKWNQTFPFWVKARNERMQMQVASILTRREYQIALFVLDKLTNKEIAARMDLSSESIKAYLKVIYQKLNISSRHELENYII